MARTKPFSDPARIELLVLDVDGVLTDGSITYVGTELEAKSFSVRDGMGLRVWRELGYRTAIITGRGGDAVVKRAGELKVEKLVERASPKWAAFDALIGELGVDAERVACVADDWNDLGVMERAGYPIAVADADSRVLDAAAYVTQKPGGRGAVREAVEHLLSARGELEKGIDLVR